MTASKTTILYKNLLQRELGVPEIEDITIGAAVLGTGGEGNMVIRH